MRVADHVKVYSGGEFNGKPLTDKVLFDSSDPKVIEALKQALAIEENAGSIGHDACYGDPTIEILEGRKRLAVFGFHHGENIRWDKGWRLDANLKDGPKLVDWFSANGVTGPQAALDAALKDKRRSAADLQKWSLSMPSCLRSYWGSILGTRNPDILIFAPDPSPSDHLRTPEPNMTHTTAEEKEMMSLLDGNFENKEFEALAVLQWYASGVGSWTGYPSYEDLPADLLLMMPTETIIKALDAKDVSEPELEGAARFFASRNFRSSKPQDISLLSESLRQRLYEHCMKSEDNDKRTRATRAYADSQTVKSADNHNK